MHVYSQVDRARNPNAVRTGPAGSQLALGLPPPPPPRAKPELVAGPGVELVRPFRGPRFTRASPAELPPVGDRVILSLFDCSGHWSEPYRRAGYRVVQADLELGDDVLDDRAWGCYLDAPGRRIAQLERAGAAAGGVWGVLAAPPCTEWASSGNRWKAWKAAHEPETLELAHRLMTRTLAIAHRLRPVWFALENPTGQAGTVAGLGPAWLRFDPHEYAGWLDDGAEAGAERYTKRTCIWGEGVREPERRDLGDLHGSKMHKASGGGRRGGGMRERSNTPRGFAAAFFAANP